MRLFWTFLIILLFVLPANACWAKDSVDICTISSQSVGVEGNLVSFNGHLLSDGMHSTVVIPDKCPQLGFSVASAGDEDPWEVVRESLMRVGLPGTSDKDIAVDLDAEIVRLGNGRLGLRVTKLNRMVITYPSEHQPKI